MQIYLPIAELPLNVLLVLGLGGLGGVLAGMFGIGGGFLITPMLIFMGVSPAVAVATSSCQIIASSVSGVLAHWQRNNVDVKMGLYLLVGGLLGAVVGVSLFTWLKSLGQIDLAISVIYVMFLGSVGALMAVESSRTILDKKHGRAVRYTEGMSLWAKRLSFLPFSTYFPRSDLTISGLMPVGVGLVAGIMVSVMGIGGGFIMIPAMIYLLGMPTSVVVGTSLFQIVFTTSAVTVLHAINTQTVDIVLALLLITGGVVGAQFGTKIATRLPAEKLRWMLAIMVLAICLKLALGLVLTPSELFTLDARG